MESKGYPPDAPVQVFSLRKAFGGGKVAVRTGKEIAAPPKYRLEGEVLTG